MDGNIEVRGDQRDREREREREREMGEKREEEGEKMKTVESIHPRGDVCNEEMN